MKLIRDKETPIQILGMPIQTSCPSPKKGQWGLSVTKKSFRSLINSFTTPHRYVIIIMYAYCFEGDNCKTSDAW